MICFSNENATKLEDKLLCKLTSTLLKKYVNSMVLLIQIMWIISEEVSTNVMRMEMLSVNKVEFTWKKTLKLLNSFNINLHRMYMQVNNSMLNTSIIYMKRAQRLLRTLWKDSKRNSLSIISAWWLLLGPKVLTWITPKFL